MDRARSRRLGRRGLLGGLAAAAAAASVPYGLTRSASADELGTAPTPATPRPTRPPGKPHSGRKRPNILLILLDDLGWGEVGCYGQKQIRTPVIDRLATQGARFTTAYATPTCAPSRAALMQGLHSGHASVRSNAQATDGLNAEDVTVAQVMRNAGYRTALFGKWGLGPSDSSGPSHPSRKGFDEFFGYLDQIAAHDYWPTRLWRNLEPVELPRNRTKDAVYAPDLFTKETLSFLDRADGEQPFFLTLAYNTPHAPNEVPSAAPYAKKRRWGRGERNHAAQITWTDKQIGKVLDRLEQRGLLDDTLVIVTSDNGPHRAGRQYEDVGSTTPFDVKFFNSNGPFRGIKRSLYEGGIRVPLVVRLPQSMQKASRLKPGDVVDDAVALWDFFPTFAELAGVPSPTARDGVSLVPLLKGRSPQARPPFYWERRGDHHDQAVRWGQWKLIRFADGRRELYDLSADRREKHNLAAERPETVWVGEGLIARSVTPR